MALQSEKKADNESVVVCLQTLFGSLGCSSLDDDDDDDELGRIGYNPNATGSRLPYLSKIISPQSLLVLKMQRQQVQDSHI